MISNDSYEIGQKEKKVIVEVDIIEVLPGSYIELAITIWNSKKIHLYSSKSAYKRFPKENNEK